MAELQQLLRRRPVIIAAAGLVVIILAAIVAVVLAGGGSSASPGDEQPTATATATATRTATSTATAAATATPFAGILDGAPMTADEWAARKDLLPLAVMFDNTPNSIPHHGLGSADLVYEAFVEGGITRLMAVFWRRDADPVMAVRSARTPFVIWVDELGALYAHAGSATTNNEANAAGQIIEWGIKDLDAFKPGSNSAYYRDSSRYAPYNLATSTARLRAAAAALGFQGPPAVESWQFRNPGDPPAGTPAGGIQVDFSGRMYSWQLIQWRWDEARNAYGRFQFGGPQVDGNTGEQLFFTTVIVMRVNSRVVDSSGHVLLDQFGEGPATVFTGGRAIEGTWRKADRKARTRFYDTNGNEIAFERGPIFIEVLGQQSDFTVTASAADLPPLPKYTPPPPGPAPADDDVPTPAPTSEPSPAATATPTPSPVATPPPATPTPAATADQTASPEASTATPAP
ncbi:DUF3048 domain-containing protein [Tepidiforma flava]|uniref:DUF3048 domain-containing protein n=1 Tax=Tepidiforma flava TaxID=3004094 RepID=A0ABY7M7Q4_9CHLR|nr:DUF3048 domain-containing protein [Tepidiforma flava]WBL36100.1 DUF3048 domain-containing protein [Tepidiforma flava]